ncbi:hypothetical protein D3C81_2063250 [compost metagenome]
MVVVAVDHDFSGAGARVVVAGHRHAVGASGFHRQHIALLDRQLALPGQPVGAFAHGAHDVVFHLVAGAWAQGLHAVVGLVERRAQQVVHGGVDNGEVARLGMF